MKLILGAALALAVSISSYAQTPPAGRFQAVPLGAAKVLVLDTVTGCLDVVSDNNGKISVIAVEDYPDQDPYLVALSERADVRSSAHSCSIEHRTSKRATSK